MLATYRANHRMPLQKKIDIIYIYIHNYIWSNYSDLTRPHPKWWFSKGNPLISVKSRLVKYYNLARLYIFIQYIPILFKLMIARQPETGELQQECIAFYIFRANLRGEATQNLRSLGLWVWTWHHPKSLIDVRVEVWKNEFIIPTLSKSKKK